MANLWTFPCLDGMLESIQFRTDVIRSRAAEQRIRLTDIPRRTLNQSYRLTPWQYDMARAIVRQYAPGPIYLPEWSEAVRVDVGMGQTVIPIDTAGTSYAVGGYAAIVGDSGAGEVLEVASVSSGSVTLTEGPDASYEGARFAPAFPAYVPNGLEASHDVNRMPLAQAEWLVFEGSDISDDGGRPTYRGDPLLDQCAAIGSGALSESLRREVDQVDNGLAIPFFDDVLTQARQSLGAAFMPRRGLEVYELKQWFHYLKGQQRAFWLPCWNRGIEVVSNIGLGDPIIAIRSVGFSAAYGSGDLFLKLLDGTTYAIQVDSAVDNGTTETLTLTLPAPAAIDVSDLSLACLLFRVRTAVDRIEFAHIAGYGARVVVPCIEVPLEAEASS